MSDREKTQRPRPQMNDQADDKATTVQRSDPPMVPGRGPGGGMAARFEKRRAKDVRGTTSRLATYLGRYWRGLVGTVLMVTLTSVFNVLTPYLLGLAIDDYMVAGQMSGLARMALLMLGAYTGMAITTWLQTFIMVGVSQNSLRDLRNDLFAKLQTLSLRYFDQHTHGELMSRLTNDIENISNILTSTVTQLISSILTIVGVAIMMFVINWRLALVSILVAPATVLVTQAIAKHTRENFRGQQRALGELNSVIEETITGERVVKAYVREEGTIESFEEKNGEYVYYAVRAQILSGFMGPISNMLNNASFAVVAGLGGWFAVKGLATVGTIASFVNYSRQFTRPINEIAQLYNSIQSALAGAERVFEVMDEIPEITDAADAHSLEGVAGRVVFDDVCFSYEPTTPVLKHVSLVAEPGQTIALVGPTGAGKTTVINLMMRFYDVDSGSIRIDGRDIRDLKMDELRRHLGIVLQDNFLFGDSVLANIRYGRMEATDEEVYEAARLANADTFIHRLPYGYNTVLTERGSNLSQGQRQLLAIARTILANPDILILDEATSNVDTRTERHLQDALLRLMAGRTSFVIAHRLSTIREADKVLVINYGEVIEEGTHESLLAAGGFYHDLYYSQFRGKSAVLAQAGH